MLARTRRLSGGEGRGCWRGRRCARTCCCSTSHRQSGPYNVGAIEAIVEEINGEQGTTIILVTRNVFQARRLAHRVGLLLDGELVEVGSVDAFFEAPTDPRTAAFARGEMIY